VSRHWFYRFTGFLALLCFALLCFTLLCFGLLLLCFAFAMLLLLFLLCFCFCFALLCLLAWSRFLREKLIGSQLVKKFPAFYGKRVSLILLVTLTLTIILLCNFQIIFLNTALDVRGSLDSRQNGSPCPLNRWLGGSQWLCERLGEVRNLLSLQRMDHLCPVVQPVSLPLYRMDYLVLICQYITLAMHNNSLQSFFM